MTHAVSNSHNCIYKNMLIWHDTFLVMKLDVTRQVPWLRGTGESLNLLHSPMFPSYLCFFGHMLNIGAAMQVAIWWYVQWWCWGAVMMQGRWRPPCVPRATWTTTLHCPLLALRSEAACWHHTSLLVEPSMSSNTSRWRLTCCAALGSVSYCCCTPPDPALLLHTLSAAVLANISKVLGVSAFKGCL